jgi:uncharacterized protein DUF6249
MQEDVVVPIAIFGCFALIVWMSLFFAAKRRIEAYKTIQLAIEKGQPMTPEALGSLARMRSPIADLRWGIVLVSIAAGFVAFATVVSFGQVGEGAEFRQAFYGIATFPLFVGLALLGLHFFANESKRR